MLKLQTAQNALPLEFEAFQAKFSHATDELATAVDDPCRGLGARGDGRGRAGCACVARRDGAWLSRMRLEASRACP